MHYLAESMAMDYFESVLNFSTYIQHHVITANLLIKCS